MFLGDEVTVSLSTILTILVLRTSVLKSKARFRGSHPRSEIACRFEGNSAKELANDQLQRGKMLVFVIVGGKPILVLNNTRALLNFVIDILQQPFCLTASLTCHSVVPFGRPRHTIQGWYGF